MVQHDGASVLYGGGFLLLFFADSILFLLEPLIICLAVRLVGGLNDCGMPTTESQSEAAVQHREDRERDGKQPSPAPVPQRYARVQ